MIKGFHELEVWKRAHTVVLDIYRVSEKFPLSERFGVTSQLRRAAYSIPANIAEGYGRRTTREFLQFLAIANGSLQELRYFVLLSRDLNYLPAADCEKIQSNVSSVAQMLAALSRSLRSRLSPEPTRSASSRNTSHGSRSTKPIRGVVH